MKLYDAERAPSPRRVRIYLAEKGLTVERVMVNLTTGEHLLPDYLAINPRGVVPALQLDNGEIICESSAICRYFESLHPEPALFGRTPVEIARIESWTRRIENDGYTAAVYAFRNSRPQMEGRGAAGFGPPIPLIPELATRGAIMWGAFVDALEHQLGRHPWIVGPEFSFADISALVTIDFARAAKLAIPDGSVSVRRWYEAVTARPSAAA